MIPQWTPKGVLPPNNHNTPTSRDRSPYRASITDFILRYATSAARSTILQGFLSFRKALNNIGLDQGFQWVDGSFVEHVESIQNRDPHDVDVVTFFYSRHGETQADLLSRGPDLFDPGMTKMKYHVDAHFVELTESVFEPLANQTTLVSQTAYWYSVWSHTREEQWKGYLQLDLSFIDDLVAQANLDQSVQASPDDAASCGGEL